MLRLTRLGFACVSFLSLGLVAQPLAAAGTRDFYITTIAGTGVYDSSGDGGPARNAAWGLVWSYEGGLAIDSAGNLCPPAFSRNTGGPSLLKFRSPCRWC